MEPSAQTGSMPCEETDKGPSMVEGEAEPKKKFKGPNGIWERSQMIANVRERVHTRGGRTALMALLPLQLFIFSMAACTQPHRHTQVEPHSQLGNQCKSPWAPNQLLHSSPETHSTATTQVGKPHKSLFASLPKKSFHQHNHKQWEKKKQLLVVAEWENKKHLMKKHEGCIMSCNMLAQPL